MQGFAEALPTILNLIVLSSHYFFYCPPSTILDQFQAFPHNCLHIMLGNIYKLAER